MADAPDTIDVARDRDLVGRGYHPWIRRAFVTLLAVLPILALANLFGQRPGTSKAAVSAGTLSVYAPTRIRGGLLYEARFHITAHREIKKAILVLGSGWLEGTTLNTLEPSPTNESSQNGNLALELGHIPQHKSFLLFAQFQVNPTNVGHRSRKTVLYDGSTRLAEINQKVTVFP